MTADERQRLTDDALEASIVEWERKLEETDPNAIRLGSRTCPLCSAFLSLGCRGCPVMERTGRPSCTGSPYWKAANALHNWQLAVFYSASNRADWRKAAQAEIDFLKSCRRPAK